MSFDYSPQISIDVLDYSVEGDEFDESASGHIFTFEVKLHGFSGNNYIIRRSFSSIYDLDAKLRRTFPKSNIISLPLGTIDYVADDNFQGKVHSLAQYFGMLLEMPEILRSSDICTFLDFEYANGMVPASPSGTSVLDIILSGVVPSNKTVIRTFEISLEVKATDVVAWSFSTKSRDIGFNITLGNLDLVAYQRYNSHVDSVMGSVVVPQDGTAVLIFDNTYSKIMAKSLTYAHTVLSAAEIEQKTSSIRQSLMYGKWRSILKRCLMQQASDFTPRASAINTDQLLHGLSLEEMRCDKLETELEDMKGDNARLRELLRDSTDQLAQATCRSQEQASQVAALEAQVATLRDELVTAKERCLQTEKLREEVEAAGTSATEMLRVHAKKMLAQNQEKQAQLDNLKEDFEKSMLDAIMLRDTISRLKGEKKKLREFCIDMRGALEEAKAACEAGAEREKELLCRAEAAEEATRNTLGSLEQNLKSKLETIAVLLSEHDALQNSGGESTDERIAGERNEIRSGLEDCLNSVRSDVALVSSILNEATSATQLVTSGESPDVDGAASVASDEMKTEGSYLEGPCSSLSSLTSNASPGNASSPTSDKPRSLSFTAKKEQLKSKIAAAAALAASKAPIIKRRGSGGAEGSIIKRRSSEAKHRVISGLTKAANKLESSMDRAFNFLDIEGLLDDNDDDSEMSWQNKKPPGLGTYYV